MIKIEIPEAELFKAEVLGYLPEEYVEPAVKVIESQDPGEMGKKINGRSGFTMGWGKAA